MKYRIVLHFSILLAMALSGCTPEDQTDLPHPPSRKTYVSFRTSVLDMDNSPSGIVKDDINDVNVYAYREGRLEGSVYGEDAGSVRMSLDAGRTYDIYVLANVGKYDPPADESSVLSSVCELKSMDDLNSGNVPMSAKGTLTVGWVYTNVDVRLVPLVSRIGLMLQDPGGYEVKSVSVKNCPSRFTPFRDACQASSVLENGYRALPDEVAGLNEGKMWYVNVLENCQGVLMPENSDPLDKTPENLPADKVRVCTYLEVEVSPAGHDGDVRVLRFCVGQDAVSDFNMPRNTYTKVVLRSGEAVQDGFIWSVGYEDGVPASGTGFVAAGSRGNVVYTDSYGEIIRTRVGERAWNDMLYAQGKYVLAGDGGSIAVSSDGRTWQTVTAGDADWKSLAYGAGRFIAAGWMEASASIYSKRYYGCIAVSEDGVKWSVTRTPDYRWKDIAYGDGKFIATGSFERPGVSYSLGRFFCSEDGIAWEENEVSSRVYPRVIYGNGMFVALDSGVCIYSADGLDWTSTEYTGFFNIDDMAYGYGTYVAAGRFGTVITSHDGHSWEMSDDSGPGWASVSYSAGKFILAGDSGKIMYGSGDGGWTLVDTGMECRLTCACLMR